MGASDTKCAKCAPGYFEADPVGDMDTCTACTPIQHCTKSFCTGADDAICLECAFGWYPAGSICAPVVFDGDRSLFCYEVGPTKAKPALVLSHVIEDEDAGEEAEYEYEAVCNTMMAEAISESFGKAMAQATQDQAPFDAIIKLNAKFNHACSSNGCELDSDDMGSGFEVFVSCSMPRRRRMSEDALLAQL